MSDENSGDRLLYGVQRCLKGGDPSVISSVALTKRAGAVMALSQGDPHTAMVVLMFLGAYSRDFPFFLIHRKEKGDLIVGMPTDRQVH